MNPEEIKAGETYNVRVRVALIEPNRIVCRPLYKDGTPSDFCPNYFNFAEAEAFYPAENVTKSAKNAQKYDPCRKFKERDKVRYCAPDGRIYADRGSLREHIKNRDFTHVVRDEQENGRVGVYDPFDEENPYYVPAHALELITPVEELGPYMVKELKDSFIVYHDCTKIVLNDTSLLAKFMKASHPNAKAAAETECARLNAEWRKEQEQ